MSADKWLTVEEICAHLSLSKDTVYKWIKEKQMPASKVGRKWMFKKEDVDHWVKSGKSIDD